MESYRVSEPPERPAPAATPTAPGWSERATQAFVPLLILTLPFEFTAQYFPSRVLQVSRLVMLAGLALFAVRLLLRHERLQWPRKASFALLGVFVFYAALSAVITRTHDRRMLLAALAYFAVMLLVYNWTRTWDDQWRAWSALALSGAVIGLVGIVLHLTNIYLWRPDSITEFRRANATFGDPNIYARFLALAAVPSILLFADFARGWRRYLILACALIAALALPFTFSRAGWVFFFVGVLLAGILARRKVPALAAGCLTVIAFGIVLFSDRTVLRRSGQIIVHVLSPPHFPPYLNFLYSLPLDPQRRYLVAAGLQMFFDRPIFGVGYGNYQFELLTRYPSFLESGFYDSLPHTTLVAILAELGIVGLALVVAIVFQVLREAGRLIRPVRRNFVFILAALLGLFGIFIDSQIAGRLISEPYLWVFLGLLYAAEARLEQDRVQPSAA